MAIIDELRTPLYFAAGTADLAVRQARKVPALIEQIAAEAPGRIEAVRKTDPKAVQEKVQEKVQATVAEVVGAVGGLDTDLKKLGETAQDLALRGVGVAAEYTVKAREKYEEVAARGEETVRAWRGETTAPATEITVVVEPEPEASAAEPAPAADPEPVAEAEAAPKPAARKPSTRKAPAKKAAAAKADVTAE